MCIGLVYKKLITTKIRTHFGLENNSEGWLPSLKMTQSHGRSQRVRMKIRLKGFEIGRDFSSALCKLTGVQRARETGIKRETEGLGMSKREHTSVNY